MKTGAMTKSKLAEWIVQTAPSARLIPRELIATAKVPGGVELRLVRHGGDHIIMVDSQRADEQPPRRLGRSPRHHVVRAHARARRAASPDRRLRHGLHPARRPRHPAASRPRHRRRTRARNHRLGARPHGGASPPAASTTRASASSSGDVAAEIASAKGPLRRHPARRRQRPLGPRPRRQ